MYKAIINKKETISIAKQKGRFTLNELPLEVDVKEISPESFHIVKADGKSYNAEILDINLPEKVVIVMVNGNKYSVELKDTYDELLHSLGMDVVGVQKLNDMKAPMPGLVLNILVEEGQEVKKDDALLILEAMKMENIIKSPADGVVKTVKIKERDTVEKNQVLISFK